MTPSRFIRTAQAEEDLIDIWSYIAADNARAADRLLDTLDEKSQLLADNPRLGVERPDIAPDVRAWRVANYLILYREIGDGVEIVRYAHGARRLQDLV